LVCPKCGEAWEPEFVACWKCGYGATVEASDDPAGGDQEPVGGEAHHEEVHLLPAPALPALRPAYIPAEIEALHASRRGPIVDWILLAGLPWLALVLLDHPIRGLLVASIVLVLHLVMLVGVASPYLFEIALAVTASVAATQAVYATVAILSAIPVVIEESLNRGYYIMMMVSAAVGVWFELIVMLKVIALRRELTRLRQTSAPPSPL
jgi:hypothetical protein